MGGRLRRRRLLPVLLLALVLVSGCATLAPSIPSGMPSVTAGATGSRTAESAATGSASSGAVSPSASAAGPVVTVSAAARADPVQLGVQIYWHTTGTPAKVRAAADQVLDYAVGLGANSVGLTFPFFTDGVRPTRVYAVADSTPDPATLRVVIAEAQARGLRIMLRPVLDEANITNANGAWRGSIQPPNVRAWFASYRAFLAPYLVLAQETRVGAFVVGTELESLAGATSEWAALTAAAAQRYSGELGYAQNWDNWGAGVASSQAPNIGVDAYPQLRVGASATEAQLTVAWKQWLQKRSAATLARTVIQEVGIPAVSGAYAAPARWAKAGDRIDAQIQIDWFAAACRSAKELGLPGIYFWDVDSYANPAAAASADSGSFIGRGDQAIKACFGSGWGG